MKKCTVFLAVVFYLTGMAAHSQSLGDLAREEQKRRESISGGVILILESAQPVVLDNQKPTDDGGAKEDGEESVKKASSDELEDLCGNPESYWRNTMSDARNMLKHYEGEMTELTSLRNALQLQHDSANGSRRGQIKDVIDRARDAQELNRKNLEEAQSQLQSLLNNARTCGALPGWIE